MLRTDGDNFILNDRKFNIYSGAIHYFRTIPQYWRDRLSKLKACGLNTVETYVCWNLHEPQKGKFNFEGMLDLVEFIKTAQELDLFVIVRPGPYICAEWDFGGLPAWLLATNDLNIRCFDERYLKHVKDYFSVLLPLLIPFQISNGGNIIAMQIENEYGSYGNDKTYLAYLKNLIIELGIDILLFTSDGPDFDMLSGGTLPDTLKTANFGSNPTAQFKKLRTFQETGPLMCMEYWLGWFDHWGDKIHHFRPYKLITGDIKDMLSNNWNFNLYMFSGGTNFGFMSGANLNKKYAPTTTSYDYDALLTEYGGYTKKYHAIRNLLFEHQNIKTMPLPDAPILQHVGTVKLTESTSLIENISNIGSQHSSLNVEYMEKFGQNHGIIYYEHTITGEYPNSKLTIDGLHDRAYVSVNKIFKGISYRNENTAIDVGPLKTGDIVSVFVEAMGRINYGPESFDAKGGKRIRLNNQILYMFKVYTLPLDNITKVDYSLSDQTFPKFMRGSFCTERKDDCFVWLRHFTKGYVWINGFNLGRYWKIGPQKSLYLPGPLLKEKNEIVVLELEHCKNQEIMITNKHKL
ncbi:MAG: beta-galactosidase [Christensenellaceae bacterium]|jgi:beta-galactosidase|nr:beta-galactosidase [Christensenellaceae bacterium]